LCAFDDRPTKQIFSSFEKEIGVAALFSYFLAGCHPTKAHRHTVTTTTTAVMMMMATSPSQSKLLELAPAATPGK
jgi:ABC-type uncharacterized transport system auxiliary subunit